MEFKMKAMKFCHVPPVHYLNNNEYLTKMCFIQWQFVSNLMQ